MIPQHLLSRFVGLVANSEVSWIKNTFIRWAIWQYNVDISEALEPDPKKYRSFNHFFTRKLRPGIRPISGSFCSPADGEISACGDINAGQVFQAKGINYSLGRLLASDDTDHFNNGSFMTVYLSPKDYHRVHCPIAGSLTQVRYIPGKLFSVNQHTASNVANLFADNERLIMEFDTDQGKVAVIMVGAMIVAAIRSTWRDQTYQAGTLSEEVFSPPKEFAQCEELGEFQMGSTAIIITEKRFNWLQEATDLVRLGEAIVS